MIIIYLNAVPLHSAKKRKVIVLLCHKMMDLMERDRTRNSNELEEVRMLEF
jgi:hypothetical protein